MGITVTIGLGGEEDRYFVACSRCGDRVVRAPGNATVPKQRQTLTRIDDVVDNLTSDHGFQSKVAGQISTYYYCPSCATGENQDSDPRLKDRPAEIPFN